MLIDHVTITVEAGKGGNGRVSFKRNAQTAKGGPDGGNGGLGGNVYMQGVDDILGLKEFQFKKHLKAEDGIPGGKSNLYGRKGEDITLRIPLGTIVTNTATDEQFEITNVTDKILIAKGGVGGRGNNEFKSAINQTPYYAEKGTPGELKELRLDLKLIADVGLIGLPNAGKSSLLATLTNARPKIGNYAFTTLEPNIGMFTPRSLDEVGFVTKSKQVALADIPGLIEGAHTGKGLGIEFLRHIEKTKLLLHCISVENDDVMAVYQTIREELDAYSPTLTKKPETILLTKVDLATPEEVAKKIKQLAKTKKEVITLSIYDEKSVQHITEFLKEKVS